MDREEEDRENERMKRGASGTCAQNMQTYTFFWFTKGRRTNAIPFEFVSVCMFMWVRVRVCVRVHVNRGKQR